MKEQTQRNSHQPETEPPMPTDLAKAPQVASSRPKVQPQPQFPKKS